MNIITLPGKIHVTQIEGLTDYSKQYLTFEALENGTISFNIWVNMGTEYITSISYSIDDGLTWVKTNNINNKTENLVITVDVHKGDNIMWKGNAQQTGFYDDNPDIDDIVGSFFSSTCLFNAYGNIMSLLWEDNFINQTSISNIDYAFTSLFWNYDTVESCRVVNAKNLILPAITLTSNCYEYMFKDCTSLIAAPELPATTLNGNCYTSMFSGCTSLTTAPELPATTLASSCYYSMFSGCTSLTTAPKLPATTLASSCYASIFSHCTSLTTAPNLPAITLANNCYASMFKGCTSLTTAPELHATTLATYCYGYMFQNCTSLTAAPKLPATTLVSSCYNSMFSGCINLTIAPELPATTLVGSCYSNMFKNCTSLTTAPELPATTLVRYCYAAMFHGCTSLNYIKALFTTTPSNTYTHNWVSNVAATGIFVKNSAATWTTTGVNGVPSGWLTCKDNEYSYNFGISTTESRESAKTVIIPTIKELHIGQTIIIKPQYSTSVSPSTIKLNNFDAYNSTYNRNIIGDPTEMWNENYACMWLFNGEKWAFVTRV